MKSFLLSAITIGVVLKLTIHLTHLPAWMWVAPLSIGIVGNIARLSIAGSRVRPVEADDWK